MGDCSDASECTCKTPNDYGEETLNKYALQGSTTAKTILNGMAHNSLFLSLLETNQEDEAIRHFAECCRSDKNMKWNNKEIKVRLLRILQGRLNRNRNFMPSELDRDVRICYAYLRFHSQDRRHELLPFVTQAIDFYSEEELFYEIRSVEYSEAKEFEENLQLNEEGLAKFPHNLHLMWSRLDWLSAQLVIHGSGDVDEIIREIQHFMNIAPIDHHEIPHGFYIIARLYGKVKKDWMRGGTQYLYGLESEVMQLPCSLAKVECCKKNVEDDLNVYLIMCEVGIINEKELIRNDPVENELMDKRLYDPDRMRIIIQHRHDLAKLVQPCLKPDPQIVQKYKKGEFATSPPSGLQPITLSVLAYQNETKTYNGAMLEVSVIEKAKLAPPFIELVVEDADRNVERCLISNLIQDETTRDKLGFGTKMTISNPVFKISSDDSVIIRIENPGLVYVHPNKDTDRCRFCGKGNSTKMCSACKACYCSRECQIEDWKTLKHKVICSLTTS